MVFVFRTFQGSVQRLAISRGNFDSFRFRFEIPENTEGVIRLPAGGEDPALILNGKAFKFIKSGRFIEFRLKSGSYSGSVTGSNIHS